MGLDAVELVLDVEEHFNVKLTDAECEHVATVADLAALVISHLPRSEGVCTTARAFFELRTLMVTLGGFERQRVRPKARLEEFFPRGSRRLWTLLRKKNRRVPQLIATARADRLFLRVGALAVMIWLIASAALWGLRGGVVAVPLSIVSFAVGVWAFRSVYTYFAQDFPPGIETVADVARYIAPMEIPLDGLGERLVAEQRVLEEVRKLTAQQFGLPLERVQPTTNFVKDLEIG
ncbi:MAG: acyl carrier protein [Phycisphaeraceae bacterium]|nr:acyl carrier protein [Phycisphaeraceae bacterium]